MQTILSTLGYIRNNNQILMIHKNKKKNIQFGKWNGLGGKMEAQESPENAIVREIREESNLIVQDPALRGILYFPNFCDQNNWLVFVYTFYKFHGAQLQESSEGTLHWVKEEQLLSLPLWEGDKVFIPWILNEGGPFFSATFLYKGQNYMSHEVSFYEKK